MSSRLEAEHRYKVFGRRQQEAIERLSEGAVRENLRAEGTTTAGAVDASFAVDSGEIFAVTGLSGPHESALLRRLNGSLEPTTGHVRFDGESPTALGAREPREARTGKLRGAGSEKDGQEKVSAHA